MQASPVKRSSKERLGFIWNHKASHQKKRKNWHTIGSNKLNDAPIEKNKFHLKNLPSEGINKKSVSLKFFCIYSQPLSFST